VVKFEKIYVAPEAPDPPSRGTQGLRAVLIGLIRYGTHANSGLISLRARGTTTYGHRLQCAGTRKCEKAVSSLRQLDTVRQLEREFADKLRTALDRGMICLAAAAWILGQKTDLTDH